MPATWMWLVSNSSAVDVEEPETAGVEAVEHHGGEPLHDLVAERGVRVCLAAKAGGIDGDRSDRLHSPSVQMPAVGREEPRPSDHVPRTQGLNDYRTPTGGVYFEVHRPSTYQVQRVGRFALAQQETARREDDVLRAPGDEVDAVTGQTTEERMVRDELSDLFRHFNPLRSVGRHAQCARGRFDAVGTNVPKVRLPGHFRWTARVLDPGTLGILPVGFVAGWLTIDVNPDKLLGATMPPLVSLAVAIILFDGGLDLTAYTLKGDSRLVVRRLRGLGIPITRAGAGLFVRWSP